MTSATTTSTEIHRLPRPADSWDWQLLGACRDMDSDVFFHPAGERGPARTARESRAKQICRSCPVIDACRKHALAAQEPHGVWGGLSVAERTELLPGHGRTTAIPAAHVIQLRPVTSATDCRQPT